MDHPQQQRHFGMGRGKVFPSSEAKSLLNPLRRLVQSPARTVAAVGAGPSDHLLEVGCGPGFFTPDLTRAVPDGRVVALDLQGEMVRLARERSAAPNLRFVQGDASDLPFADATFHCALVATVLGEVLDRSQLVPELRRVLRRGGVLAISETRRDSDFIAPSRLRSEVEGPLFEFLGRTGSRWQYVARFAAK